MLPHRRFGMHSDVNAAGLIREARRRSGMTQAALAAAADMTQPVISAYEGGKRQPTLPMLLHVLHAAGFELDGELVAAPHPVRVLARNRAEVLAVAARHGAEQVRVVGSVGRGDATDASDIDLLVRFGREVTLLGLSRRQVALIDLLRVPVDVVAEDGLRPTDPIAGEAVTL